MSSYEENLVIVAISIAALIMASLNNTNKNKKKKTLVATELCKKRSEEEPMLDMESEMTKLCKNLVSAEPSKNRANL